MDLSDIFTGLFTPAKWRALGEHLAGGTIRGGPGLRVRQVGNRTIICARRRGGPGGGGGQPTALYPSLATVESVLKLSITPGFSADISPAFGAGTVNDIPAPAATITAANKLWLKITWIPGSDEADGVHWIESGGSLSAAEFVLASSRPTETPAAVAEDGTVTNGVFVFLWATIVASGETFVISGRRSGNHDFTFCTPSSLKLLFD